MQARSLVSRPALSSPSTRLLERVRPVIDLRSLTASGMLYENSRSFDGGLRFGPAQMTLNAQNPADWLARQIEHALSHVHTQEITDRPVHVDAPCGALCHPDAPTACLQAVASARACPQEVCLEFENASFSAYLTAALAGARALRRVGFRLGLDARQSSCALANPALRLLIDVVHVDAAELGFDLRLARRVTAAHEDGIQIVAHGAAWRDHETLLKAGVDQIVSARADA